MFDPSLYILKRKSNDNEEQEARHSRRPNARVCFEGDSIRIIIYV